MYDVITIGSATRDVFVIPSEVFIDKEKKYKTGEAICFTLGSKIDVPEMYFRTGGSALNTAITLAKQGLRTAVFSKVGDDSRCLSILNRLREVGVSEELVQIDKKYLTAYSIIIAAKNERTILAHRGATEYLGSEEPIPFDKLKEAKWFYITHLAGESSRIFFKIIEFADKNGVKIAWNPGSTQLKLGKKIHPILEKIDVITLNQEEGAILTGIDYEEGEEIFCTLDRLVKGFVIMTKGPKGFVACNNKDIYKAGILKEPKYIDRTGAGDAFGSGVVAAIIKGKSLEEALQTGSANATGVLGEWGANEGLLTVKDDIYKFGRLEIEKKVCEYD